MCGLKHRWHHKKPNVLVAFSMSVQLGPRTERPRLGTPLSFPRRTLDLALWERMQIRLTVLSRGAGVLCKTSWEQVGRVQDQGMKLPQLPLPTQEMYPTPTTPHGLQHPLNPQRPAEGCPSPYVFPSAEGPEATLTPKSPSH